MEFLIGTSVLIAVLLLGGLISLANERQRRAIDGLREQIEAWAEQDIRIKRERIARQITPPEPLTWLEKVSAVALGSAPRLVQITTWQENGLAAIIGSCQDGRSLVFTPLPRVRLLKALKEKRTGGLNGVKSALLGNNPKGTSYTELSIVTNGLFFDIEASLVWQSVVGEALPVSRLTLFEVPMPGRQKK